MPDDLPVAYEMARATESGEAIASMAAHPDHLCRLGAATNPHTPAAVLRVLGFDSVPAVALQALIHPQHPAPDIQRLRDLLELTLPTLDPERQGAVMDAVERVIRRIGD